MGQAISSEFLINHTLREVLCYDNFLSGNIFHTIEHIKDKENWSSSDNVEYFQVDGEGEDLEYLEHIVCSEQYSINKQQFPKVLLKQWKME
jgi:hypothetical protein